jgi:nitronate monooxygenase
VPSTALTRELGIEHPIFSVGFALGAGPELAAAVSNAGGLGVLGAGGMPGDNLAEQIARVRELTDKVFGVNLIIDDQGNPALTELLRERFHAAIGARPPLLVLFAGDPAPFVEPAHEAGVKVFIQVGSPAEAGHAADAGVDGVIAQGSEAGGHVVARHSLFVTLPTIVDAVDPLPVLASGGIADGRGLAAAICLGAQGVSLGTRFVACDEAFAHDEYKRRVVESSADDTVYVDFLYDVGWPGVAHRVLKTRTYDEWVAAGCPPSGERPGEGEKIGVERRPWGDREVVRYSSGMFTPWFEGDIEHVAMWAGESVELVREIKPAGEIVRQISLEADEVLARL